MATIKDNGDGTFTITQDDGSQEIRSPDGTNQVPVPTAVSPVGETTEDGDTQQTSGGRTAQEIIAEYALTIGTAEEEQAFNTARSELVALFGDTFRGRSDAVTALSSARQDVLGEGAVPGTDITEDPLATTLPATTPTTGINFLPGGNLPDFLGQNQDFFSDPAFSQQVQSFGRQGRNALFEQATAQAALASGGASPFVEQFAGALREPLDLLFQFGQQLPLSATGESFNPANLPNFANFLSRGVRSNLPGGGAFQNVINDILDLQGNTSPGNPFNPGISDFFTANPGSAFDLGFGASGLSPFNPFFGQFQKSAQRGFNAAIGAGGNPLDFLTGSAGGGFGGFFG